jgi:hypothetical protein
MENKKFFYVAKFPIAHANVIWDNEKFMTNTTSTNKNSKKANDTPGWIWKVFFLIYLFVAVSNSSLFFRSEGPIQTYYKILIGFQNLWIFAFLLNALAVIFDVLAILMFWAFVENKPLLSARTWKYFFVLRFAFFVTGHAYDFKAIQSLMHHDLWVAISAANFMLIIQAPSYIANYLYAFVKFPSKRV